MSLEAVSYSPGSCIRCGGADGYELAGGDVVKIYLNQTRVPAFPEWIEGIVTATDQASPTDTSRTYSVQYNTDDLDDAVSLLSECDISSLVCESCCEILQAQLDAIAAADEPIVGLTYQWSEDYSQLELIATVETHSPIATIVSYAWEGPDGDITPSGAVTDASTLVDSPVSGGRMAGIYTVTVTDSEGHAAAASVTVDSRVHVDSAGNTAVGLDALLTVTSGDNNTAVGKSAGDSITTGSDNVILGKNADVLASTNDNSIVIGSNATGLGSDTGVFGDGDITTWKFTAGNVGIGITPTSKLHVSGTCTITGITALTSGTASTNTTSGSLIVTGGVGVSGALFVGTTGSFAGILTAAAATASTTSATGALVVTGGAGIGGALFVGTTGSFAGILSATSNTASTTTTTGALVVTGGVGLSGALFAGGAINTTSSTASTSTTTGSLIAGGGAGIAGALFVGTTANVAGVLTVASGTATPAAGSTSARLLFGTTAGFGIYYGSGAPTVSAAQGSLYLRSDGTGTGDRMYVNTNGTTGWTAVTTAS